MNYLSRVAYSVMIAGLCSCGDGDKSKIADMATSCIMSVYHENHDIQDVKDIKILNFGSDTISPAEKSNGVVSIIPFDAEYSILLRSADGAWENGLMHLEVVRFENGGRKIRKVAVPGDNAYSEQLSRFEPWTCDEPPKG